MHNVIATGSTGNAILYNNNILVDIGVPFAKIKPYMNNIDIVLLTHEHKDHINIRTLERLAFERPALRVGCADFMVKHLSKIKNIDVYTIGDIYDYGIFSISPIKLYHDVPNIGYRIFIEDYKIIHATDTAHLNGISAKDYDLYAIEHNYNEDTINDIISVKISRGEFAHEKGSINTHLSEQKAREFIFNNEKESSEVLRLHESRIGK